MEGGRWLWLENDESWAYLEWLTVYLRTLHGRPSDVPNYPPIFAKVGEMSPAGSYSLVYTQRRRLDRHTDGATSHKNEHQLARGRNVSDLNTSPPRPRFRCDAACSRP